MQNEIFKLILEECARQDAKWGKKNHEPEFWAVILGEEYGEVCRAILEKSSDKYVAELIQVAAVCVSMLECHFRNAPVSGLGRARLRLINAITHAKSVSKYQQGRYHSDIACFIKTRINTAEELLRENDDPDILNSISIELEAMQ